MTVEHEGSMRSTPLIRILRVISVVAFIAIVGACGRYGKPIPPEALAPKAVEELTVTAVSDGVTFAWHASDVDRRGKELKFVDGYSLRRKEILEVGDETDDTILFDEIAFVADKHVEIREELRKAARAEGRVGRRIEAPSDATIFNYVDKTAQTGKTYLYQIIPMNQSGEKGVIKQVIRVVFDGEKSDIDMLDSDRLEEGDEKAEKKSQRG